MLIAVFASLTSASAADAQVPNGFTSWAVVISTAADEASANRRAEQFAQDGGPVHEGFPKAVNGGDMGLADGWLVIAAFPSDGRVADKFAAELRSAGYHDARSVPAKTDAPENLRLLLIDSLVPNGNGAPLYAYGACLGVDAAACVSRARPGENGRLILPYLAPASPTALSLFVDVGDGWTCMPTALGNAVTDAPTWLKGATQPTCYESSIPKKRERIKKSK
jgi:hypothetical protein